MQRPPPVSVLGWVWVALGALGQARSAVNLILWRALRPAFPPLAAAAGDSSTQSRRVALVFEHFNAIVLTQGVLALAVLIAGWQFPRLREWARVALRIVSVLALVYVLAFAAL